MERSITPPSAMPQSTLATALPGKDLTTSGLPSGMCGLAPMYHVRRQHLVLPRWQLSGHRSPSGAIGSSYAPSGFPGTCLLWRAVRAAAAREDGLQGLRSAVRMRQVLVEAQQERGKLMVVPMRSDWAPPERAPKGMQLTLGSRDMGSQSRCVPLHLLQRRPVLGRPSLLRPAGAGNGCRWLHRKALSGELLPNGCRDSTILRTI
eukprot:1294795-Amphidinium_carterae.2